MMLQGSGNEAFLLTEADMTSANVKITRKVIHPAPKSVKNMRRKPTPPSGLVSSLGSYRCVSCKAAKSHRLGRIRLSFESLRSGILLTISMYKSVPGCGMRRLISACGCHERNADLQPM